MTEYTMQCSAQAHGIICSIWVGYRIVSCTRIVGFKLLLGPPIARITPAINVIIPNKVTDINNR